jgi:hypothetical protein
VDASGASTHRQHGRTDLVHNVKHLGKVLPEVVRRGTLDSTSSSGDERLDSGRVVTPCKLLLLSLASGHNGASEELLVPGVTYDL